MANSNAITSTGTLSYTANRVSAKLSTSFQADQLGDYFESGIQNVGTAEESLDAGDVTTIGFVGVRNMDETNYIEVGGTTGVYSIKLKAGEGFCARWNHNDVFVKANTAACKVEYLIIEA
jgi:hypothetical protein